LTIKIVNALGDVVIDRNVVAKLAAVSAMECYGLVGMVSKNATSGKFYVEKQTGLIVKEVNLNIEGVKTK